MKNNGIRSVACKFLKQNIRLLALGVIIIPCVVLLSLVPPQLLKKIVDDCLMTGNLGGTKLLRLAVMYIGALILIGVFDFAKEIILTVCGQKLSTSLRVSMMQKAARVRAGYFTQNGTGDTVSRFTNDVATIQTLFTNGVVGMAIDAFKIVGIMVSIAIFSVRLSVIVLLLLPVIYLLTHTFRTRMLAAQSENRRLIGRVNDHIPESVRNIEMVKAYCKEDYMEERYGEYIGDSYKAMEKVNFYDSAFSPIVLVLRAVVIAAVVMLCADGIGILGISVGTVAAAIELITNIFKPIESIGMEFQNIQQAVAGVKRIDEFLHEDEESVKKSMRESAGESDSTTETAAVTAVPKTSAAKASTAKTSAVKALTAAVEFENVSFSYDDGSALLQNISFSVRRGERVTLSGRTGAGKSTIIKLMTGALEPCVGSVRIFGQEARTIPNAEKRRIFGYVEQTMKFVDGTLAEQVTLGDSAISDQDVQRALRTVGLHECVMKMKDGYGTKASSELFSQGQKQLLSIARAIVADPPILLLDEMTANLDADTENEIFSVLRTVSRNKTIISVSHRTSAILSCDRIIALSDGRLVKQ